MRLGCNGPSLCLLYTAQSFNEAEARAPRMHNNNRPCNEHRHEGFNEAEARAPRMPPGRRAPRRKSRPFNEAEARAPRMLRYGINGLVIDPYLQ